MLGDQMRSAAPMSPLWRASTYWIGRTYAELERRQRDDWGNALGWATRDYGDERQ